MVTRVVTRVLLLECFGYSSVVVIRVLVLLAHLVGFGQDSSFLPQVFSHTLPIVQVGLGGYSRLCSRGHGELGPDHLQVGHYHRVFGFISVFFCVDRFIRL